MSWIEMYLLNESDQPSEVARWRRARDAADNILIGHSGGDDEDTKGMGIGKIERTPGQITFARLLKGKYKEKLDAAAAEINKDPTKNDNSERVADREEQARKFNQKSVKQVARLK
jgi:hypothetical protein